MRERMRLEEIEEEIDKGVKKREREKKKMGTMLGTAVGVGGERGREGEEMAADRIFRRGKFSKYLSKYEMSSVCMV